MSDFLTDPPPLPRCMRCFNVTMCCACHVDAKLLWAGELRFSEEPRVARMSLSDFWTESDMTRTRALSFEDIDRIYGSSREGFISQYAARQAVDLDEELRRLLESGS